MNIYMELECAPPSQPYQGMCLLMNDHQAAHERALAAALAVFEMHATGSESLKRQMESNLRSGVGKQLEVMAEAKYQEAGTR